MAVTCPPLRFEERSPEGLEADPAFWRLYEASFRPWLREPREVIVETVRRGAGIAFVASDGDATVGLSVIHLLEDPAAVFLVYLALEPRLRGQRLGGELLERSFALGLRQLRDRGRDPVGCIWEVDDPALSTGEAQAERRQRRIAFFAHHGGALLERRYLQPPVSGDQPVPMLLMARPEPGHEVDAALGERLVRAIYREKYWAVNGVSAPLLESLLEDRPAL